MSTRNDAPGPDQAIQQAQDPLFKLEALLACLAQQELPEGDQADVRVSLVMLCQDQLDAVRKALWGEARCP